MRRLFLLVLMVSLALVVELELHPVLIEGLDRALVRGGLRDVMRSADRPDLVWVGRLLAAGLDAVIIFIAWVRHVARGKQLPGPGKARSGFPWLVISLLAVVSAPLCVAVLARAGAGAALGPALWSILGWHQAMTVCFCLVLVLGSVRRVSRTDSTLITFAAVLSGGAVAALQTWPVDLSRWLLDPLATAGAPHRAMAASSVSLFGGGPVQTGGAISDACARDFLERDGIYRPSFQSGIRRIERLNSALDAEQLAIDAVMKTCAEPRSEPAPFFQVVLRHLALRQGLSCLREDTDSARAVLARTMEPGLFRPAIQQCLGLVAEQLCGFDETKQAVVSLRSEGAEWEEIGGALGRSGEAARKLFERTREEILQQIPEECRSLQ